MKPAYECSCQSPERIQLRIGLSVLLSVTVLIPLLAQASPGDNFFEGSDRYPDKGSRYKIAIDSNPDFAGEEADNFTLCPCSIIFRQMPGFETISVEKKRYAKEKP